MLRKITSLYTISVSLVIGVLFGLFVAGFCTTHAVPEAPRSKPRVSGDLSGMEPRDLYAIVYMLKSPDSDPNKAYDFANTCMNRRKKI